MANPRVKERTETPKERNSSSNGEKKEIVSKEAPVPPVFPKITLLDKDPQLELYLIQSGKRTEFEDAKREVMKAVPYILKEKSKTLGYSFASEEEFIEKLRPSMIEHGFTVSPLSVSPVSTTNYLSHQNKRINKLIYAFTFRLRHRSGCYDDSQVVGEAADTSDKGSSKASTIAMKYFLRQSFLIQTGDDPDRYREEELEPNDSEEDQENLTKKIIDSLHAAKDLDELMGIRKVYNQRSIDKDLYEQIEDVYWSRKDKFIDEEKKSNRRGND